MSESPQPSGKRRRKLPPKMTLKEASKYIGMSTFQSQMMWEYYKALIGAKK